MEQVRPYSTLFTSRSMAAGSVQRSTARTGPNTSSDAIRISWRTPWKIVGSMKLPPANSGASGRLPPHSTWAPSFFAMSM